MAEVSGLTEVDFEIALTAFVASAVASFPTGAVSEYPLVKVVAGSLLVLTLFRGLAVINRLREDTYVPEFTTHLLHLFTYVSVLYLYYNLSIRLSENNVVALSAQTWFLIITPIVSLGVLLGQEVGLRDALRGSEDLFTTKSDEHRGSVFGGALRTFALFIGTRRGEFHNESRQSNLGEFYEREVDDISPEEAFQWTKSTLYFMLAVVVVFGSVLLLGTVGILIFDIHWVIAFALLVSVFLVSGSVDIWYSLYGVLGVGDRNGFLHLVVLTLTYLFVGQMLFVP